jgi:serine protease AprX
MTTSRIGVRLAAAAAVLAACLLVALPETLRGQSADATAKLDRALQQRAGQLAGRSRVIVEFIGNPDARVITGQRGRAGRRIAAQRAQAAEVDNAALAALASDPRVARIAADRDVFPTLARTGAATGATLARQQYGVTGRGVGVVVIDSGIASWHNDLHLLDGVTRTTPPLVHFKDFTRESATTASDAPSDEYGHGTVVAGVVVGSGFDSNGARMGQAPGAHLVVLKVLDADGHGYMSDVIAAIDYAVAMKDVFDIGVINLSVAAGVTESYLTDPLALAAQRAVNAGIVVVAAAGNLGQNADGGLQYGGITSPGNAHWVVTVGAASHQGTTRRSDDRVAGFSSRGPTWINFTAKPDLVAPGVGIESTIAANSTLARMLAEYLLDGTHDVGYQPYLSLSGTSMAAPMVTSTVALMLEANPALTPSAVKAILQYTAQILDRESPLAQGAGLLNTAGAVRMARFFAAPETGLSRTADVIEGELVPWSRQIIWGNHRLTGGVPLPGANAWTPGVAWGARSVGKGAPVVWGARTADDTLDAAGGRHNIVWATGGRHNIVWATGGRHNIVWATTTADNVVWGTDCAAGDCRNTLWGARRPDGTLWGTAAVTDRVVWPTGGRHNIVWATGGRHNIVWATGARRNIVWATGGGQQIVWTIDGSDDDASIWTSAAPDRLVWPAGVR